MNQQDENQPENPAPANKNDAGKTSKHKTSDLDQINSFFLAFVIIAILFVLLQGVSGCCSSTVWIPLLWAMACLAVGAGLGFLFGIPKIVQKSNAEENQPESNQNYASKINTNLMEISDWLTKIIVGLGLINLKQMPDHLKRVVNPLADCLSGHSAFAFALGIVVCFSVVGFLFGYLYTRLFIALMLDAADRTLAGRLQAKEQENIELRNENAEKTTEAKANEDVKSALQSVLSRSVVDSQKPKDAEQTVPDAGLLNLAREYEAIQFPTYRERVTAKNTCANEMLAYIIEKKITKNAVAAWAAADMGDGLIVALASFIAANPQNEDLVSLLSVAGSAKWLHAKYRVVLAFRELLKQKLGNDDAWRKVAEVINLYHIRAMQVKDASLASVSEELLTRIKHNLIR